VLNPLFLNEVVGWPFFTFDINRRIAFDPFWLRDDFSPVVGFAQITAGWCAFVQQASPYRYFPLLRHDYPIRLLNMLGKGGFAEVWQVGIADAYYLIVYNVFNCS
jgi:hypothetical protein